MIAPWLTLFLILVAGFAAPIHPAPVPSRRIAFIIESWYPRSHADVIGTRLLEGYRIEGRQYASPVTIASVYPEAPRAEDQTQILASKYGFRSARSIADALLDDPRNPSPRLVVDGILLGTREDPPRTGQLPSPTPRLLAFREILRIFDLTKSQVPIFFDKMLAANWQDSLTIVNEAKRRGIPLMGGSVLSYMPLDRPLVVPGSVEVGGVVVAGPYWAYAFHAAEALQSVMEQRAAQERGVSGVREIGQGWRAMPDRERWGADLLEALLAAATTRGSRPASPVEVAGETRTVLLQYVDGTRGLLAVVPRAFDEGEFVLGVRSATGLAVGGIVLRGPPFDHFSYLAQGLVEFFTKGRAVVPIEHTLLTTGIVLHGQLAAQQGQIATPSMIFTYTRK